MPGKMVPQSRLRLHRSLLPAVLWLAASCAAAQAPAAKPLPPTPQERALAAEIAALPLEDAQKKIASADASMMTAGLNRAIADLGTKTDATDPHHAFQIFVEAEAVAVRADVPMGAADDRAWQATAMQHQGEMFESIHVLEQAMDMYKAASAPPGRIAGIYNTRSIAYFHLGDMEDAIAEADQALSIDRLIGDDIGVARVENGLGNIFVAEGDFGAAETVFQDALRIARAHDQKLGEAFVLNNLATMYGVQGDFVRATRFCEESIKLKREVGNEAEVASSLVNLANYRHRAKHDTEANQALQEADAMGRESNHKFISAYALSEMGVIQIDNHHPEAALKLLKEGDRLAQESQREASRPFPLEEMASASYDLGDYAGALRYSREAMGIARSGRMLNDLSDANFYSGQALVALGRFTEARADLQESVAEVEQVRDNVAGGASERQSFLAERTDAYRLLSALTASQRDWPAAFDVADKGKGRLLLDVYTAQGKAAGTSLTPAERIEEARLQSKFLSLDAQLDRQDASPGAAAKSALEGNLQQTRADLSALHTRIYDRAPELRLRRADFTAMTLKDVQTLMPNSATALLEYELTSRGAYLFVLTRGAGRTAEVHGYPLKVSQQELAAHVRRFHQELATRSPNFAVESRWLYTALLAPARLALQAKTSLIIVPDGVLWHVPFQALQRPDTAYMVESAAIDYVPSLAVLHALRAGTKAATKAAAHTMLILGNPGGETPEQADEATALEHLYGTKNSVAFLGKEATLTQFRHSSPSFDLIHIAAHGIYEDHDPMSSHMLLASASGGTEAGWLRARDLQQMNLHAELVVLSGCETGEGSFKDGEGVVGMSWAVLAAGAHATLASTWRVEASSTTQMMLAFHQNLRNGVSKAEALRHAELSVLHNEKYAHPFYWASFVLMGDGD